MFYKVVISQPLDDLVLMDNIKEGIERCFWIIGLVDIAAKHQASRTGVDAVLRHLERIVQVIFFGTASDHHGCRALFDNLLHLGGIAGINALHQVSANFRGHAAVQAHDGDIGFVTGFIFLTGTTGFDDEGHAQLVTMAS